MSPTLEQGLIILVFTSIVVLVVLSIFLVKVLLNVLKLTKNLDETTTIINNELEPTIKELNQVLINVNKIADSADSSITNVKSVLSTVLGATGTVVNGLKSVSGSFLKGFISAYKFFSKK